MPTRTVSRRPVARKRRLRPASRRWWTWCVLLAAGEFRVRDSTKAWRRPLHSWNKVVPAAVAALTAVGLAVLRGCTTRRVNAPDAPAKSGYLDIYANRPGELRWGVECFDGSRGQLRRVIWDSAPSPDGILRLELTPGRRQLRLTCLNLITAGPAEVYVRIKDGQVTPVCVRLAGVLYGQNPRPQDAVYHLSPRASASLAYRPKNAMPYAAIGRPGSLE